MLNLRTIRLSYSLLLIGFVWLMSPAVLAEVSHAKLLDAPIKSDVDQRSYSNIELPNGMKVLLISDPTADKSAAALDVATGSDNDPRQRQGLAHFLEHMLFLGTKKFPQSGEYQEFISAHGGSHNAYTSLEHTNYFFDIDTTQLKPALERFSQFFISPLFNEDYVEREKNAVNAEYQARINDDARRMNDVYRELYAKENPASKFSVGSLETLADRPNNKVRDDLLAYYQQHYSANVMTLVVLGREPLPVLQAMVEQYFAEVPNRKLVIDQSAKPVFRQNLLPAKVYAQSQRDERHLVLSFPLPSMQPFYRVKPDAYVSYLLGHEGEGSLLYVLKQKGWAESLVAGSGLSNRFAATMDVDIKLTQEGYQHIDDILALSFDAIALLRQSGVAAWRYQEQKNMMDIAFRFSEKADAMMFVSTLANNLQYFPAKEVMRGAALMEGFDQALIDSVLSQLKPDNVLVGISAPDIKGDQHSKYYNTAYRVESIPDNKKATWIGVTKDSSLALPAANPFIPENLKLKHSDNAQKKLVNVPKEASSSKNTRLWFLQDTQFKVPKGNVMVYFYNNQTSDSAENALKTELFVRLLRDKLNPTLYSALLGGLELAIEKRARGVSFSLAGYSEKQGVLLKEAIELLQRPEFNEARFNLLKAQLRDELNNVDKQAPYKPLMADIPVVLMHGYWSRAQYLAALDAVTLQSVQQFAQGFIGNAQAEMLVYGNFEKEDAKQLAGTIQRAVDVAGNFSSKKPLLVAALKPEKQPSIYVDAMQHNDAALVKYFQAPADTVVQQVHLLMLEQVLAPAYFNSLRTEQQLGYIVTARYLPLTRVPGLAFLVQSPSHSAADIDEKSQEFIQKYFSTISQRDDAWFEQQKRALLVQLEDKPKNQSEQAERFFDDLTLGYNAFDSRAQKIAALQKMTKQDLLVVYQTVLLSPERREMLLVSPGKLGVQTWLEGEAKAFHRIDDIDAFKASQPSYSLP
ncbi:MAG: insulinase family protein [Pseudomonadales bacterium]